MADTVARQRQLVSRLRDRAAHVGECDWPRLRDELHALADLAAGIGADLIALAAEHQQLKGGLDKLTEIGCRFGCDAESSCDCAAHRARAESLQGA